MSDLTNEKEELRERLDAKKKQVEARLSELKADSRAEARDEENKLRAKLDSLEETLKSGWDDFSNAVSTKLNKWLKDA